MDSKEIISRLPYEIPFLFVDELLEIEEDGAKGTFTFSKHLDFYKGHFKDNPVTPGVILSECCAQIGVVCLGIYLLGNAKKKENHEYGVYGSSDPHNIIIDSRKGYSGQNRPSHMENIQIGLSSSEMEFLLPVFPGEKVTVTSQKIYFRFQKLKCAVKMYNAEDKLVCKGEIAGMISLKNNEQKTTNG